MKNILIAPSILSADFSCLEKEIISVEKADADIIHIDVMDGHFVPNITIGPCVVKSLRRKTKLPLDVHLMIVKPWIFLDDFIAAGSSNITIHIETCSINAIKKIKKKLQDKNVTLGISLNPDTPVDKLNPVLNIADLILVMSVNPGFGGQIFMSSVLAKIQFLHKNYSKDIEIDGGINDKTAPLAVDCGANILVAGSYIFNSRNRKERINKLKQCRK